MNEKVSKKRNCGECQILEEKGLKSIYCKIHGGSLTRRKSIFTVIKPIQTRSKVSNYLSPVLRN